MTNRTATTTPTPAPSPAELEALIDRALAAYCDPDVARRRAAIAEVWAPDGELLDPPLEGRGHAGLSDAADAVLAHFPEHTFRRTTPVDAHHGYATYEWQLLDSEGRPALSGHDVATLTDRGQLQRIVGFFAAAT